MTLWREYIQKNNDLPSWPYPIRYGQETFIKSDVLVIGGGIAGCHAALNAAKKGAKVTVVDKGPIRRSGSGGAGVDHWQMACTNPCSKVTPEEATRAVLDSFDGYDCGPLRFIHCSESWDTLLDCEKMGMKIRDDDDEFKGAEFRDDETKLMFAYDYENRHTLRVKGNNVKPVLHRAMKKMGIQMVERVMVTALLSENGGSGEPICGAVGVNIRTGEFFVFSSKATILALAWPNRLWTFSSELNGAASSFRDPNNTGEGLAMGWRAGAEFTMLEQTDSVMTGGFMYIPYGVGNCDNTYHGCDIVDAKGNCVPWIDRDGNPLAEVGERFLPSKGQKFSLMSGLVGKALRHWAVRGGKQEDFIEFYESVWPRMISNLPEKIRQGEFKLPLYSDLTGLPELERKAIWGLMVGNEGKTRVPVYETYKKAGFDPDRDMLQAPVMPPDGYRGMNMWSGLRVPQWSRPGGWGLVVDWDLKTNLKGLYAAGSSVFGGGAHASAASSGRYAGRKAAEYSYTAAKPVLNDEQIRKEKSLVYEPLESRGANLGWKELSAGISRVMQDYCGQTRSEETLKIGLALLKSIQTSENSRARAANPHELARVLECRSLAIVGQMVMQASLARKATSHALSFSRIDYPQNDPPEWKKFIVIKRRDNSIGTRDLPFDYHLKPPFSNDYEENYRKHCALKE